MDAGDVAHAVEQLAASSGYMLTPETRAAMQSSLAMLKANSKLHRLQFWGQINGVAADYLIAVGYPTQNMLGARIVYVSKDGVSWVQLPQVDQATRTRVERIRELFTGDPSHEYVLVEPRDMSATGAEQVNDEAGAETSGTGAADEANTDADAAAPTAEEETDEADEAEEEEEAGDETAEADKTGDEKKPSPTDTTITVKVTEEKRLAATVAKIDEETGVVPRGAYMLNTSGEVVRNRVWTGLGPAAAASMRSYMHLSKQDLAKTRTLLQKSQVNEALDFADPLSTDQPSQAWSMHVDGATSYVTLRSLVWPGFHFQHVAGTPKHHHVYCGNGLRNRDLGFML